MRAEGPKAYLLLHRARQGLDQPQPTAYPALAVLEASRELLQRTPEALLQLRQQPGLIEGILTPAA